MSPFLFRCKFMLVILLIYSNILKINEEYYEMINKVSVPEFEEYFINN